MSDSEIEFERSLRRAVRQGLKDDEEVTINSARSRAEKELDLDAGFFKSHPIWKSRSKDIIQAAVDDPQSSLEKPTKPTKPTKPATTKAKAGAKRKSSDVPPASNKRTRKAGKAVLDSDVSELSDSEVEGTGRSKQEDDQESEASEFGESDEDKKPKKTRQAKAAPKRKPASKKVKDESESGSEAEAKPVKTAQDESELSDAPDVKANDNANDNPPAPEDDESDMSVLIDDPPPKKKRASNGSSKAKPTKASKSAVTKKKGPDLTPDEEEIKRLQGWLVKCGIRKMWHNELKGCDNDKAKIKHLKKMLEDAGMTGRYSNEKASNIKEARELADELAATKEYAAKWGMKEDESNDENDEGGSEGEESEVKDAAAPRRPKGFVDFGDSGDESG